MAQELFQTYTESGAPLKLIPRAIVHRAGYWHRAVNVFLFRSDGRLVVQRRSSAKDVCPGAWDLSVAEHVAPGEAYADAAHRGLAEELSVHGARLEPLGHELQARYEDSERGIKDYEFQQCFFGLSDDEIRINAEEVAAFALYQLHELRRAMRETPALFTPWFVHTAHHVDLFKQKITP